MARLRAAIITDVHYGLDIKDKLGTKAPRMMKHFIKAVNKYAPDFIVDLGDRISAINEETDRRLMKEYRDHFNEATAPLHSVIGNHEMKNLGRKGNSEIMGHTSHSYSRNIGGYHLVFWNPRLKVTKRGIEACGKSIEWLEKDLAKHKDKPAIVFSHVPLDNLGQEGHEPISKYFFWTQGSRIRKVMEDAGNVVLCMGGHRHRNRHREIKGIHYITQQAFTSQWKEHYRIPSRTFSLLEAEDGKITVHLRGKFRKTYELTPKFPVPPANDNNDDNDNRPEIAADNAPKPAVK